MGPIVFHALFSLVQGMNIGYRPYAFGPVGGTGHVGSRVLKGVISHGCFRPVPRFRHGQPRKGRFSVNTSILPPLDVRLPFPPMRMCIIEITHNHGNIGVAVNPQIKVFTFLGGEGTMDVNYVYGFTAG